MTRIQAVPKVYSGVKFRSTLEADWAYNLDLLGIVWQYEPEALKLPSGTLYRPDFYLPILSTWLEVKGPHDERIDKTRELASVSACPPDCMVDDCSHWWQPWRLTVIGRAPERGRMMWEPGCLGQAVELCCCQACGRHHFMEQTGNWACRGCGADGKVARWGESPTYGSVPFGSETWRGFSSVEPGVVPFKQLGWK